MPFCSGEEASQRAFSMYGHGRHFAMSPQPFGKKFLSIGTSIRKFKGKFVFHHLSGVGDQNILRCLKMSTRVYNDYRKNSKIWDTSNNCHNCPKIEKFDVTLH